MTSLWIIIIIALYSLAKSSFSPRIISFLIDDDAPSASAGSDFVDIDLRQSVPS